jgi:ubiquinone/menaquinone biosynthesis C-methylase UbiE
VQVTGIDISEEMLAQLRAKRGVNRPGVPGELRV